MLDAAATILTLAVFSSGLTLHQMAVSLHFQDRVIYSCFGINMFTPMVDQIF